MIGKDLVKYHSQIHGPVHYTDALASYYGLSGNPPLPPRFEGISGDTRDGGASKQDPFQGHMFIQGCVDRYRYAETICEDLYTSVIEI